jgi:hypothetical protein
MSSESSTSLVQVLAMNGASLARARAADAEPAREFNEPQALLGSLQQGSSPRPPAAPGVPAKPARARTPIDDPKEWP